MVKIVKDYYTKNRCFTNNRNYKKSGGIVHTTATPGVMAEDWKRRWNNQSTAKAVTAFLDDSVVVECMPYDRQIWHVGTTKGNNYFLGFEICEDNDFSVGYFNGAIRNAIEYAVHISRIKGWTGKDWLGHNEAHRKGFASNHGDPEVYFRRFGYSMEQFRKDVDKELNIQNEQNEGEEVQIGLKIDGYMGPETIKDLQGYFGTIQDGIISKPSMLVRELQKALGVNVDGYMGPVTIKALQKHLETPVDGIISEPSMMVKELQRRLNEGNLNLKIVKPVPEPEKPQEPEYIRLVEDGIMGPSTIRRLQDYLGTPEDGVISTPSSMVKELQKRLNNNEL